MTCVEQEISFAIRWVLNGKNSEIILDTLKTRKQILQQKTSLFLLLSQIINW